jgi:hypothetical protein
MKLENYNNIGEVAMFSHVYQFIEENKQTPIVILVNAYNGENNIFKGYLFNDSKTYKNESLTLYEKNKIEEYTGKLNEVGFAELIKNTVFKDEFTDYKERENKE